MTGKRKQIRLPLGLPQPEPQLAIYRSWPVVLPAGASPAESLLFEVRSVFVR